MKEDFDILKKRMKEDNEFRKKRMKEDFDIHETRGKMDILLEKEYIIANLEEEMEKRAFMKNFKIKSIDEKGLESMMQLNEESDEEELAML